MRKKLFTIIVLTITGFLLSTAAAETFTGIVTDSITGEELPFISIRIEGTLYGDETDADGRFSINASTSDALTFSYLGYYSKTIQLKKFSNRTINVKLCPSDVQLEEIVIKSKYSKKDNPAVDLITAVFNKKDNNRIETADYYQRQTYEKTKVAMLNLSEKFRENTGIADIVKGDTSTISGKPYVLMSVKEKAIEQYYRNTPKTKKQIITGKTGKGIDDEIVSDDMLQNMITQTFVDVDVYSSDIIISSKRFVGPLSPIAKDFYKFNLGDTVVVDGDTCVTVEFAPFNSAAFGFMGSLLIDKNTLAVRNVDMRIPEATNINFLTGLHIEQAFQQDSTGRMVLVNDKLTTEFYVVKGTGGFYCERTRDFSNYVFNVNNDSIMRAIDGTEMVLADATEQDSTFWQQHRTDTLDVAETNIELILAKLKEHPVVKVVLFTAELLLKGYYSTSKPDSKFDFGPVYAFISANTIEGCRLRFGGETTANLSKHVFGTGYMAFGCKDLRIKYGGNLTYSFNEKKYHQREFPINAISVDYTSDIRILGEQPVATFADNLFYSIKRMAIYNQVYYQRAKLSYKYESRSGFSINPWFFLERNEGAGRIHFTNDQGTSQYLYNNELGLTMRYAPKEVFIQGRTERFNIKNRYPVFTLTHRASFAGFAKAEYGYQATEIKYLQRFFLSAFGRIDLYLGAGKIWNGNTAYPFLFTPNANTSFTVMQESFSQVNPFEFLCDQYASAELQLNTQVIFNYIPGIKKLRLREVFGYKCYWGYLSDKNNPANDPSMLKFPNKTYTLNPAEPYMEFSVGIDNILKCLRVDYVRRINYLSNPDVWANGVRITLNFMF